MKGKDIITIGLNGNKLVADFGVMDDELLGSFVFQDKVRVIGIDMIVYCIPYGSLDYTDGRAFTMAMVKRTGGKGMAGSLLIGEVSNIYNTETVNATKVAIAYGKDTENVIMRYPHGYGMDFDANEAIYLVVGAAVIGRANGMTCGAHCMIHYVER